MDVCPQCGSSVFPGTQFCTTCGAAVARVCVVTAEDDGPGDDGRGGIPGGADSGDTGSGGSASPSPGPGTPTSPSAAASPAQSPPAATATPTPTAAAQPTATPQAAATSTPTPAPPAETPTTAPPTATPTPAAPPTPTPTRGPIGPTQVSVNCGPPAASVTCTAQIVGDFTSIDWIVDGSPVTAFANQRSATFRASSQTPVGDHVLEVRVCNQSPTACLSNTRQFVVR